MHYLLGNQNFYFPSSLDQFYTLKEFLDNRRFSEDHLPIIVRITSLNIHQCSIKDLLSKNIPLLLLNTYRFQSILAEYHRTYDGKYQSTRNRLTSPQGKSTLKSTAKFLTRKKLSTSLVKLITTDAINTNDEDDDDDYDKTLITIRNLNKKHSLSNPFCRIPIDYHGFFELLNENDQAVEPFHQLSDLLLTEYDNENKRQVRTEKWPQAFFLRSTCPAYTKRHIPDERKLSGSADSCYGSLSDLDPHKNLLILNDDKQILQPGQIITILNQCSAYRSQIPDDEIETEQFVSHSTTTLRSRNKSRFFFLRRKPGPLHSYNNELTMRNRKQSIYDISNISQPYLKCQTEQGDIVYIYIHASGLFSPLNSRNYHYETITETENIDLSGVFRLRDLATSFRFPISVRLLKNSVSFGNIYSPASINQNELSLSSTKFRLLLPYTEDVIFACPLVIPSTLKTQVVVIPIPISHDIEIQRCLNMREILHNKYFHNVIQTCHHIIDQYKTEFSYICFPLVINATESRKLKRKQPLFKKRSQSESHIEYYSCDLSKNNHQRSCELLNHDDESDTDNDNMIFHKSEQLYHRDSFEKTKQKLLNKTKDDYQKRQSARHPTHYAKVKAGRPRTYSRQHESNSEDENYRELDRIYDYIRSGDITLEIKKIQAKERVMNATYNQIDDTSQVRQSTILNLPKAKIEVGQYKILF